MKRRKRPSLAVSDRDEKKSRKLAGVAFIAYGNTKHLWNNDLVKWGICEEKRRVYIYNGKSAKEFDVFCRNEKSPYL